jgi:hypothetical protein
MTSSGLMTDQLPVAHDAFGAYPTNGKEYTSKPQPGFVACVPILLQTSVETGREARFRCVDANLREVDS